MRLRPTNRHTLRGVGLVELMIALALSAVLVLGISQIYISAKQTYNAQAALSRIQENARAALTFLQRDIRNADFWGCMSNLGGVTNHLDPNGTGYDATQHSFSQSVNGTEGGTGSDSLVLRTGAGNPLNLVNQPATPAANLQVQANNGLDQGDIVFISDCQEGDIFQISNSNPGGSGTVVHNTGGPTQPGNRQVTNVPGCPGNAQNCLSKMYDTNAALISARTISYDTQTSGITGEPALFRTINGTSVELASGVETFQVLYGEDTNDDQIANRYVPADFAGLDMEEVVAIRIGVLIRSDDQITDTPDNATYTVLGTNVGPFNDQRLRKAFTATVSLRNRLP